LVDVFAQEKYAGNQLAVVSNAESLSDLHMQKIANEMHFSETTFIHSKKQNNEAFNVRIFTPSTEVPFAGHPTLATAYVINRFITKNKTCQITLSLKAGNIPVIFEKEEAKRFFG
jgi:trans-2,3-dihydro-3-hydroxyanthranilate isomerase